VSDAEARRLRQEIDDLRREIEQLRSRVSTHGSGLLVVFSLVVLALTWR
jgi:hypothetical protein